MIDGRLKNGNDLMVGLKQEYYKITQFNFSDKYNLASLIGRYRQNFGKNAYLDGKGQWGLLSNLGEYDIFLVAFI